MEDNSMPKKPDPVRMHILRNSPLEIKQSLTKEEVNTFLYEGVTYVSLRGCLARFSERKAEGLFARLG